MLEVFVEINWNVRKYKKVKGLDQSKSKWDQGSCLLILI